jgi:hypothetical protein
MSVLRAMATAGLLTSLLFMVACDVIGPTSPTRTKAVEPSPPIVPMPDPLVPSTAVLAVSTFTVRAPSGGKGFFAYDLKIGLSEIGGKSGATLTSFVILMSNGDKEFGCVPNLQRVAPGATWDMENLGYCTPTPGTSQPVSDISVQVTFYDDEGHRGIVEASTPVTQ